MKKIIDYELVDGNENEINQSYDLELVEKVRDGIRMGWQPLGAPFQVQKEGYHRFYQAMVLYDDYEEIVDDKLTSLDFHQSRKLKDSE